MNYQNPKIIVGSVVTYRGKYLLCRRAIEPRRGFWTVPAGYLEMDETPEEGAKREALEEANAKIQIEELLAIYTVKKLGQIQMIYRAILAGSEVSAGDETLEVELFDWADIPWNELAFPTVTWMLEHHRSWENAEVTLPVSNPQDREFELEDHE